jgi:arylsulfatase
VAPNLLLILTDQQRADALGAVTPWLRTPAMDRLVAEGVRFTRCVTPSPACVPARVSLITGLFPHNTGVWGNRGFNLPARARTWVRAVREAGHRTSVVGKTHLHGHPDLRAAEPLVRAWGFDDVHEISGPRESRRKRSAMTDAWAQAGLLEAYRDDIAARTGEDHFTVRPSPLGLDHHYDTYVGRRAAEQLRAHEPGRPWLCCVGFAGPHEPWDAPEPYAGLYDPAALPAPLPPIAGIAADRPAGRLLDDRLAEDARRLAHLAPQDVARLRAGYAAKVSLIDHHVGELLDALEARGELDRTLVVLASDHGEMNGDHGLMHKSCFLDGAVTVPLVARLPRAEGAGRRVDAPVSLLDVGPTLAEAAGRPLAHAQWGRSLWPLLRGEAEGLHEVAVSELRGEVMLTDERWKVAFNAEAEPYLCVDLAEDPDEQVNLAGTDAARPVEARFRDRLLRLLLATQIADDWHGGWPAEP